jgi:hypothetical protein
MFQTHRSYIAVVLTMFCATAMADPSIVQPSLRAWAQAAKTGRADAWILGDSIAGAFDSGFSDAISNHFGMAGTGIYSYGGGGNGSYFTTPPFPLGSNGWDEEPLAVRADRRDFVTSSGVPATAGVSTAQFYATFLSPSPYLDPQAAYDWHLWTASPDGGGSMQAQRQIGGVTIPESHPPIATATPSAGLQHSTFHFGAISGHPGEDASVQLVNTTNTSILYSRLTKSGATGATVTTWSYGGHSARDFYYDKYLGGPTSQAGRGQFLGALTEGGSGKLMVTIEEGTNDASPTIADAPSVHGILPGNGAAAFTDNVTSLIDGIKSDWIAAGKPADDLSFLVLGMYQYGHRSADELATHHAFTQGLESLALSRADVSFVDLYDIAPSWDQANALGYMVDDVHATTLGGIVYSNAIFNQIDPVPEPSAAFIFLCMPILMHRRRSP